VRKADNLRPPCAVVTKSGKLNFLEPSGPVQACNGTALPLPFTTYRNLVCACVCVCVCARVCDGMYVSSICRNKEVLFPCNDSKVLGFDIEIHCVLCAVGT